MPQQVIACLFFFLYSDLKPFIPGGKFGSPYLGKATAAAKSSATNSYQCVQYSHGSKQWYGCQRLGFLTCAQMSMHGTAHGGCTNTVKRVYTQSSRKSLATLGSQTCISTVPGVSDALLTEPHPAQTSPLSLVEAWGFNR